MNLPADIINQALDAAGIDYSIGDPSEGSKAARVCLRAYSQCLRQLLRGANWDFARKQTDLVLLGDATGETVGVGKTVIAPWVYEYEYPIDCMKARFVPFNQPENSPYPAGNIDLPTTPVVSNLTANPYTGQRLRPARFLVTSDVNYPPPPNSAYWEVQGVSPIGRTVICTNVKNAQLIYTYLAIYPSTWDALFRSAMVSYLASEIALPLNEDKKAGLAIRAQNIQIVKSRLIEARLADGNEGHFMSDIQVDWMRIRYSGGPGFFGGPWWGAGALGYWDSVPFCDGSAY